MRWCLFLVLVACQSTTTPALRNPPATKDTTTPSGANSAAKERDKRDCVGMLGHLFTLALHEKDKRSVEEALSKPEVAAHRKQYIDSHKPACQTLSPAAFDCMQSSTSLSIAEACPP